ncbi:MAG: radical SAM protein [Candidatus Thermoplasmatota archaeon]
MIRYLTKETIPYDPLKLAKETEEIVCKEDKRKYTSFYATGVYGGMATGYAVGCCLRCAFCWVDFSRDFPEKMGEFYSSSEVVRNLIAVAENFNVKKCRISNCEPTIGKKHLLGVLEGIEKSKIKLFMLETNGIIFGNDKEYVMEIKKFEKVHVRLSLKAGDPENFKRKTGAIPEAFELPFKGIKNLIDENVSFHIAVMSDRRIMDRKEMENLILKIASIDRSLLNSIEEERVDPYDTSLARLKAAGFKIF